MIRDLYGFRGFRHAVLFCVLVWPVVHCSRLYAQGDPYLVRDIRSGALLSNGDSDPRGFIEFDDHIRACD